MISKKLDKLIKLYFVQIYVIIRNPLMYVKMIVTMYVKMIVTNLVSYDHNYYYYVI